MVIKAQDWKHTGAKHLEKLAREDKDDLMRDHLKKLQVAWKKPRRAKKRNAA